MWYIWKNRNNKLYTNKMMEPPEILRIAQVEAVVWAEAQLTIPDQHQTNIFSADWLSLEVSTICFVDGAWRAQDKYTGQGWLCRKMVQLRR